MFKDFLKQYIKDLVEVDAGEYNIDEDDIDDIADVVESNEYVWSVIDEAIYQELDNYKEGE